MTPSRAPHSLRGRMACNGSQLATRGYRGLKFNTDSLCHSYRKTWTPDQFHTCRLLARDSPGHPRPNGPIFISIVGKGKRLMAQKVTNDEKEILLDPEGGTPATIRMVIPSNHRSCGARAAPQGIDQRLVSLPASSTSPSPPESPQGVEPPFRQLQP